MQSRPYWHVDIKWVCGILSFLALGVALLMFNLSTLTAKERALNISTTLVAGLFSKEGLDDEKGLEEFRQKIQNLPGDTVSPIPQFPQVKISKQDVVTLSARELRLKLFRQITEPIYDYGPAGAAAKFTTDVNEQKEFTKNASLLGVFTKKTHQTLHRIFVITAVAAVLFLVTTIYFSAGWGRLVSPGTILLVVSPVGAIAGLLLSHPPKDGDAPLGALPPNVANEIGSSLSHSYMIAAVLGILLLLAALIGKLVQKFVRKDTTTHYKA